MTETAKRGRGRPKGANFDSLAEYDRVEHVEAQLDRIVEQRSREQIAAGSESREVPNPQGTCWCGCGQPTNKAKAVERSGGILYRPGDYRRYLPGHANHLRKSSRKKAEEAGASGGGYGAPYQATFRSRAAYQLAVLEALSAAVASLESRVT